MRGTIATVALLLGYAYASSHIKVYSKKESFYNMSTDLNNPQPQTANILMYVGFVLFGLAYIYTIAYIFYDTSKRDEETATLLEKDEADIRELKLNKEDPDFKKGLEEKLNNVKKEDKGDDQLYGTAAKLTAAEWSKAQWDQFDNFFEIKHYFNRIYGFVYARNIYLNFDR